MLVNNEEQFVYIFYMMTKARMRIRSMFKKIISKHIVKRLGLILVIKRYFLYDGQMHFYHTHSAGDK